MKALSSPKVKSLLPLLCGYLGYILWGFSYRYIDIAQIYAPQTGLLLSHRFVVSCILMLILVATRVVKVSFRGKKWGSAFLLVAFQFAYYLFETATTKHTNGAVTSLVSAVSPGACHPAGDVHCYLRCLPYHQPQRIQVFHRL